MSGSAVSRRSMLGTGAFAAVAAGLLGSAGATPVVASPVTAFEPARLGPNTLAVALRIDGELGVGVSDTVPRVLFEAVARHALTHLPVDAQAITRCLRSECAETFGLPAVLPDAPAVAGRDPVTVVNMDDLAAECRRLLAEYQEATRGHRALIDRLEAQLTPDQARLLREADDAQTTADLISEELHVAEMARHLPGLAPVLRMVWEHALTQSFDNPGACCTAAEGFSA